MVEVISIDRVNVLDQVKFRILEGSFCENCTNILTTPTCDCGRSLFEVGMIYPFGTNFIESSCCKRTYKLEINLKPIK